MPYEMTWENRGVYRRFYGFTSDLEIHKSTYETESSPRFDELRYVLIDFLAISGFQVNDPAFIHEVAAIDSAAAMTNPCIKVAIVVVDPEAIKLAEAYSTHELNPYPTQLFACLEDAREWVAVSLPTTHPSRRRR